MSFTDFENKDIKFWLLKVLSLAQDFTVNANILQIALKDFGHNLSLNSVNQHLNDLADINLVTLESIKALTIARATRSGLDVVNGTLNSDLVRRPNPEEL